MSSLCTLVLVANAACCLVLDIMFCLVHAIFLSSSLLDGPFISLRMTLSRLRTHPLFACLCVRSFQEFGMFWAVWKGGYQKSPYSNLTNTCRWILSNVALKLWLWAFVFVLGYAESLGKASRSQNVFAKREPSPSLRNRYAVSSTRILD
jgi:hypothetical protein